MNIGAELVDGFAGWPRLRQRMDALKGLLRRRETMSVSLQQLALAALMAAGCGTAILAIINAEAGKVAKDEYSYLYLAAFFVLIIAYNIAQKFFTKSAAKEIEQALHATRTDTAAKIARLELRSFEEIPRDRFYAGLIRHYEIVSLGIVNLLSAAQSTILFSFGIVYLLFLSPAAFLLTIAAVLLLTYGYLLKTAENNAARLAAAEADMELLNRVNDLVQGFKELKLDRAKHRVILEEIRSCGAIATDRRVDADEAFTDLVAFMNSTFFFLGAAVVFALPLMSDNTHNQIARLVMVVLFVASAILNGVGATAQTIAGVRLALHGLRTFETALDAETEEAGIEAAEAEAIPFDYLALRGVHYTHKAGNGDLRFSIGPIDFTARAGEIIFITGGNGSGKSTALKVITALYPAMSGEVLINGQPVTIPRTASYRSLFGAIFSDFYTFHRLYDVPAERDADLQALLARMHLSSKLPQDMRLGFNPDALSTGQRKRLALVITLLQDRPILVFDEWAADQDPEFRTLFYREILPGLKAAGKAIIAVTHDDRYFDIADRCYHMDEGKMTEVPRP